MQLSDYPDKEVEVWPENARAVRLFLRLRTQWRIGMGGPTGLDYGVLPLLIDRAAMSFDEWDELMHDLQTLEYAALAEMHRKDD